MKNRPDGLILTISLAIISAFGFNYAIHQLNSEGFWGKEKNEWYCGNSDYVEQYTRAVPDSFWLANGYAIAKGESIFENNCLQCHSVHEQVVGPALKNVEERWASRQELYKFIKNPQKIIDSGKSPYAKELFQKHKQYMPSNDYLDNEDIKNILLYIQAESRRGPVYNVVMSPN